ncbi:hypothetical protein NUU61_000681 [Penicillium alfredii]|uniref:Sulfatase N-terminal domain-containing protein n=1 Tax=Penicillium alfredii TaxID=1506179 RepID=A0A9W9GB84_9EURO|nr:uncharacterized protein NUU61_000681 [Penicillium alfredii]KAJ5114922.1 hypothetical protein NUU61_000681 [Penicillium alfredii]
MPNVKSPIADKGINYTSCYCTSYPDQNALNLIRDNTMAMLDEAIKSKRPFFTAVAPAIPHLGLNATDHGTHWPVPLPKWEHKFNDKKVPRTKNFNPNKV